MKNLLLGIMGISWQMAIGAPPQDLTQFNDLPSQASEANLKRPRGKASPLSEDAITAMDESTDLEALKKQKEVQRKLKLIRYDVACRDSAGRNGKPIVRLKAQSRILEVQAKRDWVLISYTPKKEPCWVPKTALAPRRP